MKGLPTTNTPGAAPLTWWEFPMRVTYAESRDRRVAFIASNFGDEWQVVALETPLNLPTLAALLHDHAHEVVGTAQTFDEIDALAAAWLERWLRRSSVAARCGCAAIG